MSELLDRKSFSIDVNNYNPSGFCLIHVDLDDNGNPVDWTFVYVNEALAKIEGKPVEELTGRRFFDIFPNGDRKWLKPYYEAAYNGVSCTFDDISEEVDTYLHLDVYPTDDIGYCICIVSDIKDVVIERAKRQESLEILIDQLEYERELNLKIRNYAVAMGIVYPLAIYIDYKNDLFQMIEYNTFLNKTAPYTGNIDELISIGASTIPDEKAAGEFWELFNREAVIKAFKSGKKEISLRHIQNGDDGKIHHMDTRAICTECSDEKIEGISLSKCVDEEAEREMALAKESRHAEVINALSTIYTTIMQADIKTHDYRVIKSVGLMNIATKYMDEGNFDEIREDVLTYFMHPDFRNDMRAFLDLNTLSERLDGRTSILSEYMDNNGKWLEARFIAQKRNDDGHAITALYVARDVTWEKEKERDYRQQLKVTAIEAEKANVSKTNFLRRMSHDVRTPLNGIMGMLYVAEKCVHDEKKFKECMDKIMRSADYLLDLVNNVLDISKLESGSIILENKPFDLGQLLLSALPIVAANAKENRIIFKGGRADTHIKHRYVIGSPVHLNRVLMNIASNAIKYNRPGGTIRIYCNEIYSDDKNATYEFICADTGLGMSEEFQRHAFDPFSQEGKETTTSFSGSGLGLSIVKDIVNLMGGTVELTSQEDVGTTIKIVLTMEIDKDAVSKKEDDSSDDGISFAGKKVLLVEDNELNMEIAKIMLKELGVVISEARNGLMAVHLFQNSEPYTYDFIFMDMMMPVMDGLEATREIRALPRPDAKSVPIIAMTANAFIEDRETCINAGMNDHIGKPINIKALKKSMEKFAR